MKEKLLIIGAGGHGRVVANIALSMERWKTISFLDDSEKLKGFVGINVIGKISNIHKYVEDYDIFVGIGSSSIREELQKSAQMHGAHIPTLIHSSAIIGEQVNIGAGTVVMAGTIINCCTTIGEGCIINTGSTVGHDGVIGDYVHVSSGVNLAGTVKIGNNSWIGIGSVVSNNIKIINNCKIGAGAVVVKDINIPGTYIGVPARKIS
ncbi:acetyltransferase [Ectobacillus ponti]|uniref:Acetyltransferase n=1 Tax=Ectobacillus ponti TaxID=2961894 RepID=A0AA42BNC5_9BACI|nr:acetyltransferase [Ectobacillus ponti]MCP8967840.1 acetyltransferase [Ectobacillus ponti]